MTYKNKQISIIAGVLIILGIVAGILSVVLSVESDQFLEEVYPSKNQVLTGAIFQFLLVPIYVGFSLLLYPILKQYSQTIPVGFVGFRLMAGTFQIIGMILLSGFILLSQAYLMANHSDRLIYELIGDLLRLSRDLVNHLGVILATGLGNFLFYTVLYREKLIPRWLSLWGFLGNIVIMLASCFVMAQLIKVVSTTYVFISLPIVIQEVVLAVWLLTKGLNVKKPT